MDFLEHLEDNEEEEESVDERMNTVLEVLAEFEECGGKGEKYRELKKTIAGLSFVKAMVKSHLEWDDVAGKERELKSKKQTRKQLDAKYLANTRLRQGRMEAMKKLMAEQQEAIASHDVLLVADGAVSVERQIAAADDASAEGEAQAELFHPRSCYVCKCRFHKLHHFYDQLCPSCATLNWEKRFQSSDLTGKVAIVTGGRVKIGFRVALKLLRAGATVVATTRFAVDGADRFSMEEDYADFKSRLIVYPLDLRVLQLTEEFCQFVTERFPAVHILVQNATQTVRRPTAYYGNLIERERQGMQSLTYDAQQVIACVQTEIAPAVLSQVAVIPEDLSDAGLDSGVVDVNGQTVDMRTHHSWTMKAHEIEVAELLEVFTINSISPFILVAKLRDALARGATEGPSFIVNVSAMEGQFYRRKTSDHPHTNMAKADPAMNMLTRTSAPDYFKNSNIVMCSTDTGWITEENPVEKAARYAAETGFQTPIDEIDAAARILDPVFSIANGEDAELYVGKFLKDYKETFW